MGIQQEAAERILAEALAAAIQAGDESGLPSCVIAKVLVDEARKLAGYDAVADLLKQKP
jgi:hypothetical protein